MRIHISAFLRGYIDAALWTSTDHETDKPLDKDFDCSDISLDALTAMKADCDRFQTENEGDLVASNLSEEDQGYNFWLSRNRHGSGYWDKVNDERIGDHLHIAAKAFGEASLYVSDRQDCIIIEYSNG